MAAVFPIGSVTSNSNSLVLPPSSSAQSVAGSAQGSALVLPPSSTSVQATGTATTPDNPLVLPPSGSNVAVPATNVANSDGALVLPAASSSGASPIGTASDATAPALSTTSQPLNVVFNALASAGIDTAITQSLLAPESPAATGTFSAFIGSLFDALAAQSVVQQAEQANAAQITTPANAADGLNGTGRSLTDQANATSPADAFVANSNSTAPNSALESGVQTLAQTVNSQTAVSTAVTANADARAANNLSPLQQSFDEFLTNAGGTPTGTVGLGGFLSALANNLHAVPSPLGNLVNTQT